CLACALHDDTVGGGLFGKDPCRKAAQGAQHELFELLLQVSGAVAGWKGGAVYPNRSAPSPGLAGVVCSSAVRRLRCPAGLPLLALLWVPCGPEDKPHVPPVSWTQSRMGPAA